MTPRLTPVPDPELLSQALAACTVGVIITDSRQHDHPIVYVNPAFEALNGYAADEVLGRNSRFMHGQDRDQPGLQKIRQAMAQERSTTVTLRNYRKDGTLFYNELTLSPVHDASGTLTHYLGFQNDVTAREEAQAEQRASEERFSRVFEASPIAIVVSHLRSGQYLDVNPEFLLQSGYRREEVIGRTALDLGFWTDPLEREDAERTLQEQGKFLNREVHFRLKSGVVADMVVSVVPVTIGAEVCVVTLARDITSEKQSQRVLAESEARHRQTATELQRTLDLSLDLINSIDAEGRFVTMSAACQQILGYTPEELIGRTYLDFVHPDDRAITTQEDASITAGQATTSFQNRYLHKNGSVVWLEWAAVSLSDDPLMYCVARDVTQRKAAEEDQAFLAAIVEASYNAIVGVDLTDTIRSWNGGAERLYGYTAAEAVGQPITLIIPPERHAESVEAFNRVVRGERIEAFESVRVAKDGCRVPVILTVSAVLDAAGKVIGVARITYDITALQAAERQVRTLNQHLEAQLRHVTGLRKIDQAIASSQDLSVTLGMILDNVAQQLGADAVTLLLLDPHSLSLKYAGTRGFGATVLQGTTVKLGAGLAGQVALNRHPLSVSDVKDPNVPAAWREVLNRERLMAYYGAPLVIKGEVLGVIEVLHREPFHQSAAWLETFEMLTAQAAIAVDNAQLFAELKHKNLELRLAYDETIEGWAQALDLRDKETEGHSRRVTGMAVALCRQLAIPLEQLVNVRRGALLHDIGKMGMPDAVLLKPGPLTDEEWAQMRRHPSYAVDLLSPIKFLRPALDIPHHHHEKWDGSGYPLGLSGEAIPLVARAFAVVDVYDALTSDRPYRKAWSRERALEHIQNSAGTHFDPVVVQSFVQMLEQGAL
ncbi:PAS domain S-box protein [Deinococcus alpinitundrae]|uniref:PAS domain S-box protein n=1 Tax=Deinococcus alpinitundrae TaxID=468913 RepID=UPI00137B5363|nr:PAS domain S-box protein [Deinococcus alpinitundrae]